MSKTKENVIKKIAKKNIKKNWNQNIFLAIAIFIEASSECVVA